MDPKLSIIVCTETFDNIFDTRFVVVDAKSKDDIYLRLPIDAVVLANFI